nr:FAD-dependent oxidoreductase [Caenimonas sedimenti]
MSEQETPPPSGGRLGGGLARRAFLLAPAALAACTAKTEITGAFAGASAERGHLLRNPPPPQGARIERRTRVVIAGAGIAGLAAARALRQRGIEDFVVLDLEDAAGGNSRPGQVQGVACPLGAHYLPVPGDPAREVQDLLEDLGVRRRVAGRWTYDERMQCHAPQERLFFQGQWQPGLLPVLGVGATTLAQYTRFSQEVERLRESGHFTIPVRNQRVLHALDGERFSDWLDRHALTDPQLRWHLDYCCRDDYGSGTAAVSAWAGLHYFAARHGFHVPGGEDDDGEHEPLLTWPEGNGWLTRRLTEPLGERVRTARVVTRIAEQRHGVEVDVFDAVARRHERWQAAHCIVALPAFVAARVVVNAPPPLRALAGRTRYAPWIVANLHLRGPMRSAPGAALAWDNVVYGSPQGLGYVVATHQSLNPAPGPTVLSWYCAPGEAARAEVLRQPWTHWRDRVVAELAQVHPDLPGQLTHVEVARYGHAMAIPVPGALAQLPAAPRGPRMSYAHSDWAGYSIFEEAFTLGHHAGHAAAAATSNSASAAKSMANTRPT